MPYSRHICISGGHPLTHLFGVTLSRQLSNMLVTLLYGFVFAVVKLAVAAPASTGQLAPRATRLAFVGCSPGNQVGDVLVTPPSPDGCAVSALSAKKRGSGSHDADESAVVRLLHARGRVQLRFLILSSQQQHLCVQPTPTSGERLHFPVHHHRLERESSPITAFFMLLPHPG